TEFRAGAVWTHAFDPTFEIKLTAAYWNADAAFKIGRPTDRPASGTLVSRRTSKMNWQEDSLYSDLQLQKSYQLTKDIVGVVTGGGSFERLAWDQAEQQLRIATSTFAQGVPIDLATMAEPDPSTYIFGPKTIRATRELDHGLFIKNQMSLFER